MKICSIDGCERKHAAHGWCSMHYRRWLATGETGQAGPIKTPQSGACSIDGCDRPAFVKGMCNMHRQRLRKHGDPLARTNLRGASIEERFWAKVNKRADDECWPWLARTDEKGYGQLDRGYTNADLPPNLLVHRVSYELHFGPIPPAAVVTHTCGSKDCVNPAHLTLTSPEEVGRTEGAKRRAASTLERRFWLFVEAGPIDECWEWQGTIDGSLGYGQFVVGGELMYAHRGSYELLVGPIPEGHHIHHRCHNRTCVNPAHLEPLTPSEHTRLHKNH